MSIVSLCSAVVCGTDATIRSACEIQDVNPSDAMPPGRPFDIQATITYPLEFPTTRPSSLLVTDSSGSSILQNHIKGTNFLLHAGDRVRATGMVVSERGGIYAQFTNMTVLTHGEPPKAVHATVDELVSGKFYGQIVTVRGEITDVFPDEIDKGYVFFIEMNSPVRSDYVLDTRRDIDIAIHTPSGEGAYIDDQTKAKIEYALRM